MVMSQICMLYIIYYKIYRGTQWHSWLRHCVTRLKVAGSIPDGAIGVLHLHNTSGRALGSNQPLTEMTTKIISSG